MSDQEIWNNLKSGDKKALEIIYQNHIQSLLQYGKRFTKDESVVEDAAHDLFVNIWKNRQTIGPTNKILPYLLLSLRRDIIRRLKKVKKMNISTQTDDAFDVPFDDGNIEDQMIAKETSIEHNVALKKGMEQLSKRQREVLYLKFYKDLSYKEIADVLDINYQSIRNLVSQGLKKLKDGMTILLLFMVL